MSQGRKSRKKPNGAPPVHRTAVELSRVAAKRMKSQLAAIDEIDVERIKHEISRLTLCGKANVALSTYDRIMAGAVLAELSTMARLRAALRVLKRSP